MKTIPAITLALVLSCVAFTSVGAAGAAAGSDREQLRAAVANLALSFQGYTLGRRLTAEQVQFGENHKSEKSFAGTYTVIDGTVQVVVDEQSHRVIAVYQQFKDVDQEKVKEVVATLMSGFGEPTNIAHEKIIYWLYSPKGAMSAEEFDKAKDSGDGFINIIASVKLSSSREIEQPEMPTTLYWILSSNQLSQDHIEGLSQH